MAVTDGLRVRVMVAVGVVLAEGDPMFYGSYMHLHVRLSPRYPTEIIAGVTGMSGCWSAVGTPIAQGDDVFTVLPGTLPEYELERRLADTDAAVCGLDDGGFAVAWQRTVYNVFTGLNDTEVWYAVYEADGTPRKAAALFDTAGSINRNVDICATRFGFDNAAVNPEHPRQSRRCRGGICSALTFNGVSTWQRKSRLIRNSRHSFRRLHRRNMNSLKKTSSPTDAVTPLFCGMAF